MSTDNGSMENDETLVAEVCDEVCEDVVDLSENEVSYHVEDSTCAADHLQSEADHG